MPDNKQEPTDLAEDVSPELVPPPIVTREFDPAPWHRPRKQFLRKYQWNHEIVEQIVKQRPATAGRVLRVLGLPSSEYLDLLTMQDFCEEYGLKIVYFGFNSSYKPPSGAAGRLPAGPINLYDELQAQRMIEASSFVDTSSRLVPDLFEQIRIENSMSRNAMRRFGDFDVVNLDLCGCIVNPEENKATDALDAIVELLRWQSIRRLAPWLFFVTTFASPEEINRPACMPLIQAIKENADDSPEFHDDLKEKAGLDADGVVACFQPGATELPEIGRFIRIFALAMGKWLAARARVPNPPSLVATLPGYCFRHQDHSDPHLLSLAYLISPAPSPGEAGFSSKPAPAPDLTPEYRRHAMRMLAKSFSITDLDEMLKNDGTKRKEAADETEQLLVNCGFDAGKVSAFIAKYR